VCLSCTQFILQSDNRTFNRAKLMNVGYVEARRHSHEFNCFVFHDVDLLPTMTGVPYSCSPLGPLHMITAMDKFQWR
jgi:beta-1,4-galactosyltransferase 1